MKKISLSSTMGPGVKIALAQRRRGRARKRKEFDEFRRTIAGNLSETAGVPLGT